MPTSLFQLSRKKFLRAPQLEAKLAIKILMGFVILYFGGSLLFLGIVVYPILSDQFPERDPISIINSVLVLIFIFELIIRYFLQQLPVTEIKSFLLLSIPKNESFTTYCSAPCCLYTMQFLFYFTCRLVFPCSKTITLSIRLFFGG